MLHCGPWGQGGYGLQPMAVDGMDWRHLGDLLGDGRRIQSVKIIANMATHMAAYWHFYPAILT